MSPLADRYELQELLGSGGMARVHAAVDRRLGRRVAVKLVRDDLIGDGHSRERLLREARSAASFHHPNSVAVFDVGEDDGKPFIVMELIDGESLAERLARDGRLEPTEAVRIGTGVLAALEAAHGEGLVHRDLKPANVLLPRGGGVKLADFGIAKAIADQAGGLTAVGDVMGTPNYLSPEQASGESATAASDLYSLGVVLYECLAGEPPFTGDSPLAVALAHQREPAPPLRKAAPHVPEALAAAVDRALRKDPAERYADAAEFRRALDAGLAGIAPPTVPLSPAYAETTVLPADEASATRGDAAARPFPATQVLPDDEPPGAGAPPEPGPRRRWPVLLVAVLALAAVAAALVFAFAPDETPEEPPEEDPIEEPADEEPAEPEPEDEPAEPEEPTAPEEPPEEPAEEPPADEPAENNPGQGPPANGPPGNGPPDNPPGQEGSGSD